MRPVTIEEISDTLRELSVAIASLLGLQVDVVSDGLVRVAKAGRYTDAVGVEPGDGQVYRRAIRERRPIFLSSPTRDEVCLDCRSSERCRAAGQLVWPIVHDERVIGCLGLVAVTQQQRRLLQNQSELLSLLLSKLTELISWRLAGPEVSHRLSLMTVQFECILDQLPEGVLILNRSGTLTFINRAARAMLGLEALGDIRGRLLGSVISSPQVDACLSTGKELVESPIVFQVARRTVNCVGTIQWVRLKTSSESLFCLFRTQDSTDRLAARLSAREPPCTFDNILGVSPAIQAAKNCALRVAVGDSTVLLLGESGTGKELFARAIHSASTRSAGPFVAINCGAIPDSLLESELFGYEEGAFTGARKGGKPGKFELASGGTVFLDEIGELPLHMQVKLLRVLEERAVERLGGTRHIPVDVRVIAATNADLQQLVSAGRFRRDLYYRINVVPITIPPLRERPEDIEYLAQAFVRRYSQRLGRPVVGISEEALGVLKAYSWPGNVRELQNVIEYAVNFERGDTITPGSLPAEVLGAARERAEAVQSLALMEREAIEAALSTFGRDGRGKRAAARALGIHLSTFYRKLKRYGLH